MCWICRLSGKKLCQLQVKIRRPGHYTHLYFYYSSIPSKTLNPLNNRSQMLKILNLRGSQQALAGPSRVQGQNVGNQCAPMCEQNEEMNDNPKLTSSSDWVFYEWATEPFNHPSTHPPSLIIWEGRWGPGANLKGERWRVPWAGLQDIVLKLIND